VFKFQGNRPLGVRVFKVISISVALVIHDFILLFYSNYVFCNLSEIYHLVVKTVSAADGDLCQISEIWAEDNLCYSVHKISVISVL